MKSYNKAVRDRISEMIERSGKKCETGILPSVEFELKLNEKLQEEVEEYLQSWHVEEMADIDEVVYGILEMRNVSLEGFEALRLAKKKERGGETHCPQVRLGLTPAPPSQELCPFTERRAGAALYLKALRRAITLQRVILVVGEPLAFLPCGALGRESHGLGVGVNPGPPSARRTPSPWRGCGQA